MKKPIRADAYLKALIAQQNAAVRMVNILRDRVDVNPRIIPVQRSRFVTHSSFMNCRVVDLCKNKLLAKLFIQNEERFSVFKDGSKFGG